MKRKKTDLNDEDFQSYSTLKNQFDHASSQLHQSLGNKIKKLKSLHEQWNEKCKQIEENANKAQSTITLDVGGKIFKTTKETLLSKRDTFFYAMISSGKWLPDDDGSYFIDRNPKVFGYILDYLRYGKVDLSSLDRLKRALLKEEADYYLIPEIMSNVMIKDSFDSSCMGNETILTSENKTATASYLGHTCAIGCRGISYGKQTWKLRVNHFSNSTDWIMIGVISKPITSLDCSFFQVGNFGISSKNQKYTAGSSKSSKKLPCDWNVGHVIQVDLECDIRRLKITNLNTGRFEEWENLPVQTYYLHVCLKNHNNSVTILDE